MFGKRLSWSLGSGDKDKIAKLIVRVQAPTGRPPIIWGAAPIHRNTHVLSAIANQHRRNKPPARLTTKWGHVNTLATKQVGIFRDQGCFFDSGEITRLREGHDYITLLVERGRIDPQYLRGKGSEVYIHAQAPPGADEGESVREACGSL